MSWRLLSLLGCLGEDDATKDHERVEYNCFCFPVGEDEPPIFIPDGESQRARERVRCSCTCGAWVSVARCPCLRMGGWVARICTYERERWPSLRLRYLTCVRSPGSPRARASCSVGMPLDTQTLRPRPSYCTCYCWNLTNLELLWP